MNTMTDTLETTKARKALIVEDEGELCLLLNIMLDGKDVELDHVKDISSAVEYLEKEQPDLILLDNKLPDGFGVDFISFLKSKYPEVKIIMMSGYDASVADVALENGADVFLQKPFTKDKIYQSVMSLLN